MMKQILLLTLSLALPILVVGQSGGSVNPGTTTKPSPAPATKSRIPATVERIDGKWWTTGNGFGDSEVVFTQRGSKVSGIIRYADGRTGTITGTLVGKRLQHTWQNSSGESGKGWLELSWSNFLGGPWRSQQVRDGSWTLSRMEGKWCLDGNRGSVRTVTHDANGRLTIISATGRAHGRLEGPWIYLDSDDGSTKGDRHYKGNRIDWDDGLFWTWCGRN